jgi:hypothetical protein
MFCKVSSVMPTIPKDMPPIPKILSSKPETGTSNPEILNQNPEIFPSNPKILESEPLFWLMLNQKDTLKSLPVWFYRQFQTQFVIHLL